MKLITMTDFVLSLTEENNFKEIAQLSVRYAQFLKQPLTLGMFVPCDESGNVLEEPEYVDCEQYENPQRTYEGRLRAYRQAKEKVLFENYEFVKELDSYNSEPYYRFRRNGKFEYVSFYTGRTIEHLVYKDIDLTESAIKQLGL